MIAGFRPSRSICKYALGALLALQGSVLHAQPETASAHRVNDGQVSLSFDPLVLESLNWFVELRSDVHESTHDDPRLRIPLSLTDGVYLVGIGPEAPGFTLSGLQLPAAVRFSMDGEPIVVQNLRLHRDADGHWSVFDGPGSAFQGAVFDIDDAALSRKGETHRFRLGGEISVSPAWAVYLGRPEAAGVAIGHLEVIGAYDSKPVAESDLLPAPAIDSYEVPSDGVAAAAAGPDVIVGDLPAIVHFGVASNTHAFAVATVSCNIGNQPLKWIDNTNEHPVIAQNMYRLKNGRFEQIGMSWLKHGFYAVSGNLCHPNCQSTDGSTLGVNCSDPYSAQLNGAQHNLGPRYQVNAHTGVFPYPPANPSWSGTIARRLQVRTTDIDPLNNAGALFFVEGHYVTADDAAAGNANNNASYRKLNVLGAGTSISVTVDDDSPTRRMKSAIWAWKEYDPTVIITEVQVPDEGLFLVGSKTSNLGDGFWRYEYAVQNLNSHRSAGSFRVPVDPAATVRAVGFHDVHYHSGEPFSTIDWDWSRSDVSLTWATTDFSLNANANALRWSTLYNFRFEADVPPQTTSVTLGLFRPGTPASVNANTIGPVTNAQDCNGNDVPDSVDITEGTSADCNGNNIPDECEIAPPMLVRVADGLSRPLYVTAPPDDERLFIVEQGGRILIHTNGSVLGTPFLNMTGDVNSTGEQGLLGLAFHPQYAGNGFFYVLYTDLAGDLVLARFTRSGNPNLADPLSRLILKTIHKDGPDNLGGQLQFGPDGMLYIGLGFAGPNGDALNRAQDTGSLLGKLLRLDVNNPPDYIPADNPFAGLSLPLDEIWAMGLRNPRRFSFDRLSGDLYLADVGETLREEINVQPASSAGGENYGWRCMEGEVCTGLSGCTCQSPTLSLPVLSYAHDDGDCAVTGGYVYRGCDLPGLLGQYFYADRCSGAIRSFRWEDDQAVDHADWTDLLTTPEGQPIDSIVSFGEDAEGELYIVSHDGYIYRLVPNRAVCGNGILEQGEQCDDGNLEPGDGCDENCQIEPPAAHDHCALALPLTDGSFSYSNELATTDGQPVGPGCFADGEQIESDLWYCYTAPCKGTVTVLLCGSSFDTRLAVYEGCGCPAGPEPLACNDDGCGASSALTFDAQPCQSYMIRVGGAPGEIGSGTLSILCNADASTTDCNGNGIDDAADIACGTSTDGNANGIPDECETDGDLIRGGRLFDAWWQEISATPPSDDHPLWALRPDPVSNPASGATTWRCVECHGWDYLGVDGQYGGGPHRTGFPGVLGTTRAAADLFDLLKEPPSNFGDPGVDFGHDYGSVLSDPQINDLVAFVLSGAINTSPYVSASSGDFLGNAQSGQVLYAGGGSPSCQACHGSTGASINFGTFENPVFLGTIAQTEPWGFLHKIRFAQPGAPMPSWLAQGGTNQGASDIGRYAQLSLAVDCAHDEQCDDGVACTSDICDANGRCSYIPDDDACADDGVFCNGIETCDPIDGCISSGHPCSGPCDEVELCFCEAPLVEPAGSRYLAVTPQPSDADWPMALMIVPQCPGGTPKYLGAPAGPHGIAMPVDQPSQAAWLTPDEWGGTVLVTGLDIVPETTYEIHVDCGIPGLPVLSDSTSETTYHFGDVVASSGPGVSLPPDGIVDILDIVALVNGFQGADQLPDLYMLDQYGCTPDQVIDITDIAATVDAFRGRDYSAASLCPTPCSPSRTLHRLTFDPAYDWQP